jgi:LysR family transcriptional regulator, glycine cleavage system transcriptional activator
MSKPPLQALQAFVTAARARNLTRAAVQLHLTVSALSHQIRKLEERVGRRLFERSPRGVTLTTEGQRLFDAVAVHVEGIERAMGQLRVKAQDCLTLSVMPSLASSWLIPRLGGFASQHPEVQLSLHSSINLVDFDTEPVDAALRFGLGRWPGVTAEHLFDDWVTPVASPELVRRVGKTKPGDLSRWPLLGDPGDRWRQWFAKFGGSEPKRYIASFDDSEMLLRAAAEGIGVGLGRLTLAQGLLDAGRLVALSPQRLRADFSHYLVYPPRSTEHLGLQVFRTWLLQQASAHAAATADPP